MVTLREKRCSWRSPPCRYSGANKLACFSVVARENYNLKLRTLITVITRCLLFEADCSENWRKPLMLLDLSKSVPHIENMRHNENGFEVGPRFGVDVAGSTSDKWALIAPV